MLGWLAASNRGVSWISSFTAWVWTDAVITIVGSVNMDAIARVAELPQPGQTVLARSMDRLPGGKGANQAVAAARAGSEVAFVGRIGSDTYGEELRANLVRVGVDVGNLCIDDTNPTGLAMITVDDHGENSIVVVPGANGQISTDDVERAWGKIERSRVLVAQLEIPVQTVYETARAARRAGALFILNPAPALPLDPDLLKLVDVLVPNENELARLSGLGSPIDPAASAQLVLDTGVQAVVVTRGALGALVVTRDAQEDVPAFQTTAIDTTGAGDAFVGNLAHALDTSKPLDEAVRFATAAAALSVTRSGAQSAMPKRSETLDLLESARSQ